MKIKVKISKNLKIGDMGSIFSVKKVDNGMKPVVYHKNRIISSFWKSTYFFQKTNTQEGDRESAKNTNVHRLFIKLNWQHVDNKIWNTPVW